MTCLQICCTNRIPLSESTLTLVLSFVHMALHWWNTISVRNAWRDSKKTVITRSEVKQSSLLQLSKYFTHLSWTSSSLKSSCLQFASTNVFKLHSWSKHLENYALAGMRIHLIFYSKCVHVLCKRCWVSLKETRTNCRFLKNCPDTLTEAQKEDMSGETRTYGNPRFIMLGHTCRSWNKY